MTELLPCPFCGATDIYVNDRRSAGYQFVIQCLDCPAQMECGSPKEGAEAWNRRAPTPRRSKPASRSRKNRPLPGESPTDAVRRILRRPPVDKGDSDA